MENYYRILGVTPDATASVIKIAYEGQLKALARANLDPAQREAEERLLNQAWVTLSTPAKRLWYDEKLAALPEPRPQRPYKALAAAAVAVALLAGGTVWYREAREATRQRLEAQRVALEREAARMKADREQEERLAAEKEYRESAMADARQRRENMARYRRDYSSDVYQRVDRVLDSSDERARYNMEARDRAEQRHAEDRARRQADEDLRKARAEVERQKRFVEQREREEERARADRYYRYKAEDDAKKWRDAAAAAANR